MHSHGSIVTKSSSLLSFVTQYLISVFRSNNFTDAVNLASRVAVINLEEMKIRLEQASVLS
jgi:hypothetical protein